MSRRRFIPEEKEEAPARKVKEVKRGPAAWSTEDQREYGGRQAPR